MLEWIEGHWYLAVHCHTCSVQFAFAPADVCLPECPIRITCIDCRQSDDYCAKEFVRVQAH